MINVAVVGATGVVGRKIIEVLEEFNVQVDNLYLFASSKNEGTEIKFKNKIYKVETLTKDNIENKKIDYALFASGGEVSKNFAHLFVKNNAVVIDNSSYFRDDLSVPLVIPEVNPLVAQNNNGIVANPNCSTIQCLAVLGNLHKKFGIKRVIYDTYQAVSGAGKLGVEDLLLGEKGVGPTKFPKEIYHNLIPQIDVFSQNGFTKEEEKMIKETKKILNDKAVKVSATCVRVPVINGHSVAINVTLKKPATLNDVVEVLKQTEGVVVMEGNSYPTPKEVSGTNEVYVGRIRKDNSHKNSFHLFVVADNLRKGAATNAVQILLLLLKKRG